MTDKCLIGKDVCVATIERSGEVIDLMRAREIDVSVARAAMAEYRSADGIQAWESNVQHIQLEMGSSFTDGRKPDLVGRVTIWFRKAGRSGWALEFADAAGRDDDQIVLTLKEDERGSTFVIKGRYLDYVNDFGGVDTQQHEKLVIGIEGLAVNSDGLGHPHG